ncbi:hypothetical protein F383_22078 [Gossypium arboreum]|uniref:Uncharacterized protein n=1 Tax=Gossypium arboreum TaxID=29729 RepID=A0A0B0MMK5_GOSAR|nr:hypothetical protein F383_22078 [Gossypium arboreum]
MSQRRESKLLCTSGHRFIQLAWVGDRRRYYHTIKLSCWVNES